MFHLQGHETAAFEDLAGHTDAAEGGVRIPDVSDERRGTLEIELRHTHLSGLAQAGLVDEDPRTGGVRYAHPPTILDTILDVWAGIERSDTVTG